MTVTTGLSGNEIYCLSLKGLQPGNIVVGNSVHALGMLGSISSSFRAIAGGELEKVTSLIEEGRKTAYRRMQAEARAQNATGITGVTSQLIKHGSQIEFLSIGSLVYALDKSDTSNFSTSDNGQHLYAQIDAGYKPICFSFGNVAYSMGVTRGFIGGLKTFRRGEIREFSDIFNHTRHLALRRICNNARSYRANAVLGIQTTILSLGGMNEMLMIGTASKHSALPPEFADRIITSDMTNIEMWNMTKLGYMPIKLLLGTSVYSLGLVGSISALLKSFVRGEINELTRMIYDARENSLHIINEEAKAIGADDVVGVKTYVYQLQDGLIEFLAIGTAVKKMPEAKTLTEQLPPQAIVTDNDTFFDSADGSRMNINMNQGAKPVNRYSFLTFILIFSLYLFLMIFVKPHR